MKMLSNELIKAIVESEFKDFIAIPSLEDAYKYNLLNILSFDTSDFQSKLRGNIAELIVNYGPLNLKTPKQAMAVNELINKAEGEKICIYDPTNCLTKANLKLGVGIKPSKTKPAHEVEMSSSESHGQRFHSEKKSLDLCVITKKKLQYEHIAEMLKKLTSFTEDFVKLGRKDHLLIIYEVLYAEKLKDLSSSLTKTTTEVGIGSTCKPTVNSPEQKMLVSGIGEGFSVEKEIQHGKSSWWGPEELGPRPIAYKCGEIRLICHKGGKKSFKLTTMDKFYKPFDATDDDSHIPTCKEPS